MKMNEKKEYIEREAVLEIVKRTSGYYAIAFFEIRQLPAADVASVVHGEWLRVSDDDQYEGEYYCSVCNAEEFFPENAPFAPFCWHCGAKMDGGRP